MYPYLLIKSHKKGSIKHNNNGSTWSSKAYDDKTVKHLRDKRHVGKDIPSFDKQVDDFIKGQLSKEHVVTIGDTPEVLQQLGVRPLPIVITQKTINKILHAKHGLSVDSLKQLPKHLDKPIMVFDSATQKSSLVVMTELTHEGKTVVAAIHLEKRLAKHYVNDVASVYGKDKDGWFLKQIADGRLRYIDKDKSLEWAQSRGLQLPKEATLMIQGSYEKNIQPSINDVKLKKSISMGLYFLRKSRPLHGRMDFNGLKISIENRKGSIRQWHNPDNGTDGTTRMQYPYGYIRMTEGVDGDHVDCYIGPHKDAPYVYIVHQVKAPDFKEYDEDKCMMGFLSEEDARKAYLIHYNDPRFLGPITKMPFEEFKEKVLGTKDNPQKIQGSDKRHYHDIRDEKGQYTKHGSLGHMVRRMQLK